MGIDNSDLNALYYKVMHFSMYVRTLKVLERLRAKAERDWAVHVYLPMPQTRHPYRDADG